MKIMVAMSGGVDSSVIAHLLHEQGHDIVGVMMKIWTDPLAPEVRRALPTKCCSIEHIARARSVCDTLGVPFYVVNFEDEFKQKVVDPFLQDYREGKTPNPCVACNRLVKFGSLLQKAQELECEKIATGHYSRIATEQHSDGSSSHILLQALDESKDQSYYLYTLSQEKLSKILFPLGSMYKDDVYSLAENYGVHIPEHYTESQDLCFFPEKTPEAFLRRHIADTKPGKIYDENGTELGEHKGLPFYTIGQRKGLGIGGRKIPLHVVRKEPADNSIHVVEAGKDMHSKLSASDIHWVSWKPAEDEDIQLEARISSLGVRRPGTLRIHNNTLNFRFTHPIRGIAAGQSIVLYKGEEVLGGGVITGGEH